MRFAIYVVNWLRQFVPQRIALENLTSLEQRYVRMRCRDLIICAESDPQSVALYITRAYLRGMLDALRTQRGVKS